MDPATRSERKQLEREIEAKCCREAEKRGWFVRKYKGPGRRSHPDRLFAKNSYIFFVEFKRPGNEPTPLQWLEINAMRAAGLDVIWLDSFDTFIKSLAARET